MKLNGHALLVALLVLVAHPASAQDNPTAQYTLNIAADEVILTFHAADAHGLPINDLSLDDIHLLDNNQPPRKILSFSAQRDIPLRVGILIDTSASMRNTLPRNRAIAAQFTRRLLRQQTDKAFLTSFGRLTQPLESWSSNPATLTDAITRVATGSESRLAGTAIFDTIFNACSSQFVNIEHAATGNVILLFTDGEDNASFTNLQAVVNICQRSNTAIYAFRTDDPATNGSTGPATLAALTAQTGGRVFRDDESDMAINEDLCIINSTLRNQYRLVYRPAALKHDGTFHRLVLTPPDRVETLTIRSGYYAPAH